MSQPPFTHELIGRLRASARQMARKDGSRTYLQWLDHLCSEYGYTYTSLKARIEELDVAQREAIEADIWRKRFENPRVWGNLPDRTEHTVCVPIEDDHTIPWPNCFAGSRLFTIRTDCLRETVTGPVFRIDGLEMAYDGEELRVCHDQTLLMGFIMASRDIPCGGIVKCSIEALERAMTCKLSEFGIPVPYVEIERSLWRLTNGVLTFGEYGFEGSLLSYADARGAPEYFDYALNPAFACFYYPFLLQVLKQASKRG